MTDTSFFTSSPAFRPIPAPLSSSAQAGRLSLPACTEELVQGAGPPERRSLSANQAAEPQVPAGPSDGSLQSGSPPWRAALQSPPPPATGRHKGRPYTSSSFGKGK